MNSHAQRRRDPLAAAAELYSAGSVVSFYTLERDLAPFPKPGDHLTSGAEPNLQRLQLLDESDVKIAPEPFRSRTSVMPETRQHTAQFLRVGNECLAPLPGFKLGQAKPPGIKQRAVLDMQWQFKEISGAQGTECLGRSATVSGRLVIPRRGVVGVTRFLQDLVSIAVAQQPMHPNTHFRSSGHGRDSFQFFASLVRAVPGVDSMNSNFTTCGKQPGCPVGDVGDLGYLLLS